MVSAVLSGGAFRGYVADSAAIGSAQGRLAVEGQAGAPCVTLGGALTHLEALRLGRGRGVRKRESKGHSFLLEN